MLRSKDLAFRIGHAGARLIVADRAAEAEVTGLDADVLYTDAAALDEEAERAPTADTAATDTAFILYTSGTTKAPGGVVEESAAVTSWMAAT